jgi:hypothetical protein
MPIFVSYAHQDKTLMEERILKSLRKQGYEVWYDDHLNPGEVWEKEIFKRIKESCAFIYAATKNSAHSTWCQEEVKFALHLEKPIFPVLLMEGSSLPEALTRFQYVHFESGVVVEELEKLDKALVEVCPKEKRNLKSWKVFSLVSFIIVLLFVVILSNVLSDWQRDTEQNPTLTSALTNVPITTYTLTSDTLGNNGIPSISAVIFSEAGGQKYVFPESGISVNFSADWTLTENDNGSITLTSDNARLTLYDPIFVSEILDLPDPEDVVEVVGAISDFALGARIVAQTMMIDRRFAAFAEYNQTDSRRRGTFVGLQFSDGTFGAADFSTATSSFLTHFISVSALLGSFDTVATIPCTISTALERNIVVRIGPGENRTAFTFLPANQSFEVLGQVSDLEGMLWWKIDHDAIGSLAKEAWVKQSEVIPSGDCGNIPRVALPVPNIPIASPQPLEVSTLLGELISNADSALCAGATSAVLAAQGWGGDLSTAAACVLNLQMWSGEAEVQQNARIADGQCEVQPTANELNSYYESNWALADVSAGYFALGLALKSNGETELADQAFDVILSRYSCAWLWDPQGWYWSIAAGAREQHP